MESPRGEEGAVLKPDSREAEDTLPKPDSQEAEDTLPKPDSQEAEDTLPKPVSDETAAAVAEDLQRKPDSVAEDAAAAVTEQLKEAQLPTDEAQLPAVAQDDQLQPGGAQKGEEKIDEQATVEASQMEQMQVDEQATVPASQVEQMQASEEAEGGKSKPKQLSGAVRFAVDNPELLRRFDFKESVMALKPGETEHDRDCRLAHNLYVRYNKSLKSPNCPPEVADMAQKARRGSRTIETMFADWVSSRGVYIRLKDLIAREGEGPAMAIYAEKKRLQETEGNDEEPFWLKHPELPGNQANGS
ncbi:unnamed protein product [Symbiodinium necroappetens]|uniref:Uncharacterized protein n=1 Tax=Symbiodinium necroappetens TaxID=1628268 RepID=A0A813C421_9DINO|nr:unnamed protein product [Symbiodinium necroappetens]